MTSFAITRLTVGRFFPLKHHSAHLQNSRIIWHDVAAVACVCGKHMGLFSCVWRQIALFPKWRPDLYGWDMMSICWGGAINIIYNVIYDKRQGWRSRGGWGGFSPPTLRSGGAKPHHFFRGQWGKKFPTMETLDSCLRTVIQWQS